jgi:hypothetical protein
LELEAASPKEADEKDLNEVALGVGVLELVLAAASPKVADE